MIFVLHWYIPESVIDLLYLDFQYCLCSASWSFLTQFNVQFRYHMIHFTLCFLCLYYSTGWSFLSCRHLNMFVSGLSEYFFVFFCFVFFLDTVVFAGLFEVKCFQIGLLFSLASSFTHFMLWSMTGFHLLIHFFSCWFVSSSCNLIVSSYIFSSSSGSTISLSV